MYLVSVGAAFIFPPLAYLIFLGLTTAYVLPPLIKDSAD
jgi:hypothetical protein